MTPCALRLHRERRPLRDGRAAVPRAAGRAPRGAVRRQRTRHRARIRSCVEALAEIGIDASDHVPQLLDPERIDWADVVVATCDDACPVVPGKRYIAWNLPDPKGVPLDEVRAIRDDIAVRVDELVDGARPEEESTMKYVLFVCTHNAGRSQMAQALFERYAPEDLRAESAGQEPADRVWPNVVEAMAEIGIDLAGRRPKKLDLEMQLHADWAITLGCGGSCPYVPTMVEDWQIPDPAGLSLEETRPIRDLLEAERARAGRDADRRDPRTTAPRTQMRLQRLLPSLIDEFGDEKSGEEIRRAST